jgi:hypothetical protein
MPRSRADPTAGGPVLATARGVGTSHRFLTGNAADTFVNANTVPAPAMPGIGEVTIPQLRLPFLEATTVETPAPSRGDLLQRAAELGPRMTWESVAAPSSDPVLGEKRLPHVAERRARFRRIVKGALGACLACCGLAMIVSAVNDPSTGVAAASASSLKTAPAAAVVSIESIDETPRPKAQPAKTWSAAPLAVAAVRAPTVDKQRRR